MNTQISLKLSEKLFSKAKIHSETFGYESLQDFIRETIREKLFEEEKISGIQAYLASEKSLSKNWLNDNEEKAWSHLKKEI